MSRRWVVAVDRVRGLYVGDQSWITGKLERKPVTIAHAKKFTTKKAAREGAALRGFDLDQILIIRTWW